mgnify:CR=1 FL=1
MNARDAASPKVVPPPALTEPVEDYLKAIYKLESRFGAAATSDVANALVSYAQGNEVSMIIMGAATHGLQMQRFVSTVPIKVAMDAPCTVILVKQDVPFEFLGTLNDE